MRLSGTDLPPLATSGTHATKSAMVSRFQVGLSKGLKFSNVSISEWVARAGSGMCRSGT